MVSQMHVVQNAARLAMGDHRAADPRLRRIRNRAGSSYLLSVVLFVVAAGLAAAVFGMV